MKKHGWTHCLALLETLSSHPMLWGRPATSPPWCLVAAGTRACGCTSVKAELQAVAIEIEDT